MKTIQYLRASLGCVICLFVCVSSSPQDWERTITQYAHTSWGSKEGAPGHIYALAQSKDGYLWLGTSIGLCRFDGVSFEQYEPQSGRPIPIDSVLALLPLDNGDLWIGFNSGGISLLREGRVTNYTKLDGLPGGRILALAEDRHGIIWAASSGGLLRLEGNRWKQVGKDWNYPGTSALTVFLDREGTLWATTENTIVFLPAGSRTFHLTGLVTGEVTQIAQAPNGKLWMAETTRSVRPIPLGDKLRPSDETEIRVGSEGILFDREGALWTTTLGDGVRRCSGPERLTGKPGRSSSAVESFTAMSGLTNDYSVAILQDREGNIWVGTEGGLDRFRKTNLVPITLPRLLHISTLIPVEAGDLWVTGVNLWARVHGGRIDRIMDTNRETPPIDPETTVSDRGPTGAIWCASWRRAFRIKNNRVSTFTLPPEVKAAEDFKLTEDRTGALWLAAAFHGLFYMKDGLWHRLETHPDLAKLSPTAAFTDEMGQLWFGYQGGEIIRVDPDNKKIETLWPDVNSPVGGVRTIRGQGRHIWIGGDSGLAFFDGSRFQSVIPVDAGTFGQVWGIEETSDGALWLAQVRRVVHVTAEEVEKFLRNPAYRVRYELFDSLDGLPGTFQKRLYGSRMVQGTDGRLWFNTANGLAWLDPSHISRNLLPPTVAVRSLIADGKRFPCWTKATLPPLTRDLQIQFTALSLSVPEHVHFRYKLEGYDKDWQDAGPRREAWYTNLSPRKYRFRVLASNNDGVWNEAGAFLDFSIAPTYYQTNWFRALCVAVLLGFLWTLHQFRIWKLRQSETKLQEVIATIPTFAWTASPDGLLDFLNRHYEDYTGVPVEKAVGSAWTAVVHPEDLERHLEKFRSAMATGDLFEIESRFRRADGQYRCFLTRAVPLRDSRGRITRWYGTSIEIEDRKRVEQLQADLAHINRASTISELTASLAHEIKQPIGAAVTNAEACLRLLNRNEPDLPDACEAALEMTKDARRAAEIIDRVRLLYQKGRPQLELVDVNEVVAEMLIMLRSQANRYSVMTCTDLAEWLPPLMADRVQLQQVLMNLMINGIEAMKDNGGELSIKSQLSDDGGLLISVSDDGVGLPAERADEIFNAFFTTKSQGTGLGLAITRSIVESHGGRVWATANAGRGTSFHITLPIRTTISA